MAVTLSAQASYRSANFEVLLGNPQFKQSAEERDDDHGHESMETKASVPPQARQGPLPAPRTALIRTR